MLNKTFNPQDVTELEFAPIIESFEKLRMDFVDKKIPYHVDGEKELSLKCLPRFWEYASAITYGDLQPGLKILDAGCAYSLLSPWLASKGYDVWANDANPYWAQRLAQMNEIGKKIHLDLYDLVKTNYPDKFFDRILCVSVIEHIPPEKINPALKELNRILKDEGIIVVTFDYYKEFIPYGVGNFHGAQYCQFFTFEKIKEALTDNTGFELLEQGFLDDTNWNDPPLFSQYNFARVVLKKVHDVENQVSRTSKPLRVAHISYDFYYGGIQEQVQILAEHSQNPYIEHFIVACGCGPLLEWTKQHNIPHAVVNEHDIVSFCSAYDVDIVVTHKVNGSEPDEHTHAYELYDAGIPIINQHYCSFAAHYPEWLFDHIITNASTTIQYLPQPCNYSIIPLALNNARLDIAQSKEDIKNKWGIPENTIVIGRLSRLEPMKLIEPTIRAMARIEKLSSKPVYMIIAGAEAVYYQKGEYHAELKKILQEVGNPNILFTDETYGVKKAELLHMMDINLAPTSFEGYGLIFIEPMYCGVPTITYDDHANKEVVSDGGIVVSFGDLDGLVNATLQLIDDDTLRESLGQKAWNITRNRNLPQHWCNNLEHIILDLAERLDTLKIRPIRIARTGEQRQAIFNILVNAEVEEINKCLKRNNLKAAEQAMFRLHRMIPQNIDIINSIGDIQLQQDDIWNARNMYMHAINIDPTNINAYLKLARLYINIMDLFNAEMVIKNASRIASNHPELNKLIYEIQVKKKPTEELAKLSFSDLNTNNSTLMEPASSLPDWLDQVNQIQNIIQNDPKNPTNYVRAASILAEHQLFSEAAEFLEEALALAPGNTKIQQILKQIKNSK